MQFNCEFEHLTTGECKTIQTTLTPEECQDVNDYRRSDGDELADLRAMAMALRHAYKTIPKSEIGNGRWFHAKPPEVVLLS
jgi:hypothetical protein